MRCAGALSFLGDGGGSEGSVESEISGRVGGIRGIRDLKVAGIGNCLGGFFLAVLKVVCIFVGDKKGFEEAGFVTGFV